MSVSKVHYAHTEQGAPVAFITRGVGPPLLVVENLGLSSISLALADVGFVGRLASRRTVVSFDFPGTGLSGAGPVDMSLGAQVECMGAIAKELGAGPVDVYGWGPSAAPAAAFVARSPLLVNRLVLANPCIDFRDMEEHSPLVRVLRLASTDFGFYVTTILSLLGVRGRNQSSLHEALTKGTPFTAIANWLEAVSRFNAWEDLGAVRAPTLVLQPSTSPLVSPTHVALIAARIPDAQLIRVDSAPMGGMVPETLDLIVDFLDDRSGHTLGVKPVAGSGLKIIVFTDTENHTELMQRLGDQKGREILHELERLSMEAIRRHGGSVVKSLGDGFMACFDSAHEALEGAAELQRVISKHGGEPLRVRIGVNAGEPIREDDDFFGTSVIVAARVAAHAHGGEILVSNVVRELVRGKSFQFSDRGDTSLKGLDEPVRLFELRWAAEAST